jgi:competence protein ComFC
MIWSKDFWDYLKEGFLNLLYPYTCENCGKEIKESKGYAICEDCLSQIKTISSPYCYQCGKPLSSLVFFEEKAICSDCLNEKGHFYFSRSVAYYQGVMKKCIHLLKYKKQVKLVQPLGNLMVDYLLRNNTIHIREIDLIVPVPLFKEDYTRRGFNQSGLLAEYIAEYFSIPYTEHLLIKNRDNLSQVGLSKKERFNNVRHVYSINSSFEKAFTNVLLIDDIYTTGATVKACCRELKKTSLKKLSVLTLARGI